jgi:hypothetical protein
MYLQHASGMVLMSNQLRYEAYAHLRIWLILKLDKEGNSVSDKE